MAPSGESSHAARERRREANRESARRSRLHKQMELAQLQEQVVALTYEESLLRNELKRVSDENKELASENAALKHKLGMFLGPEELNDYLRYLADEDEDTD